MGPKEEFAQFARQTIRALSLSKLPWSATPTSLEEQYVELNVADSAGALFPVSDLLKQGVRLVLVGDPGSGKTTALREFAVRKSADYLEGTNDVLPIFISLREAFHRDAGDLFSFVDLPQTQLRTQRVLLLLDGLDELKYDRRPHAIREIEKASRELSNAQILLASRPAGLSPPLPDEFRYYHLESLDSAQLLEIVAKLNGDEKAIDLFRAALSDSPFLEGLSRSPLLISLVWQVFLNRSSLPTVRAELYQIACDLLLSSWDSARAITRDRPLTLARINDVLSVIALDAFTQAAVRIPKQRLTVVLSEYMRVVGEAGSVDSVLDQLLGTGLLIEDSLQSVSFPHLSFMEFYAARKLAQSPRRLASLISLGTPSVKELAVFAAGMLTDVAPLVEAAVDRRELILAATCLREGLTVNGTLETYVLDQLRRELGPALVSKLTDNASSPSQAKAEENIHALLLKLLIDCRTSTLPPNEKGKLFESFAERLFRQCFDIVQLNTNTENGELDLILGCMSTDPFWAEWGSDILVECKNWNSNRPLKETATFAHKVRLSRAKLGFFVSMSGFTEDAIRTLRNQVADRDSPLIIPISGADIEAMLNGREKFDPFFRRSIRELKYLHKY